MQNIEPRRPQKRGEQQEAVSTASKAKIMKSLVRTGTAATMLTIMKRTTTGVRSKYFVFKSFYTLSQSLN